MTATTTVLDALLATLRAAASYNAHEQTAPAAVLWTDGERRWEPLLPRLRAATAAVGLPLLTLGPYAPEERSGPAIWLRCLLARTLPEADWPADSVPILYLPGVSRPALRAVEDCPRPLQPLAELQYRGVFWSHRNGKDWTPAAFLANAEGGLGLTVATDGATRDALERSLPRLADYAVAALRAAAPLGADYFRTVMQPDPIRTLLDWLDAPTATRAAMDAGAWAAFREICRAQYHFDPEQDGEVGGAAKLGERDGAWSGAWQRLAEASARYDAIPELLRRAAPRQPALPGPDFTPVVRAGGAKVNVDVLRRTLEEADYAILRDEETGSPGPTAAAWAEYGHIDSIGHAEQSRLAGRIAGEVDALAERVAALLDAGWQSVRVVTDHGWLLLPGTLPKAELPLASTESRKGRCARLRPAADPGGHQTLPWRWDASVRIAFAPGIACYEAGKEYEHGGLSPQECVVPVLTVTGGSATAATVTIAAARWTGQRCRITVVGAPPGAILDLRTKAADPATSIAVAARPVAANGPTSLVVENEDLAGTAAFIVALDSAGHVLTQQMATVGGEVIHP